MSRFAHRLSMAGLGLLVSLTIAFIWVAYQVSPLRDPTFQPNSANAGSLVPGWQNITEAHWTLSATILAALLSANFTAILWGWRRTWSFSRVPLGFIVWFAVWFALWGLIWLIFITYLFTQWLID